ncbi:hypothetical protein ACYF6T_01860 [Streptomyces sp. 7R007]
MSDTPVPIPSASVPAGAPPWSGEDAARWQRARSAPWARPSWSVAALLVSVVWANVATPDRPCSDAAPCGPDWAGMAELGLVAGLLYWLARLPELALVAAPALAVVVCRAELPGGAPTTVAANLSVLLALAFGCAAACERLAARRRQRDAATRAASTRHPLPAPDPPLRRGTIPIAAGLLLLAVAVFTVAQAVEGIRADQRLAAGAVRTAATVVGRDDVSVRVRTDDARHLRITASYPEDYRVGSTVTVLENGTRRRLAAEPYDAFGWQLLTLAAGLPGVSLLLTGLTVRRRAAALRRAPVPALRVLAAIGDDGRIRIHAAHDTHARTPLLVGRFTPVPSAVDPPGSARAEESLTLGAAHALDARLHEAVMFGAPYEGGELVLAGTDRDARPVVVRSTAPVRLPRPGRGPDAAVTGPPGRPPLAGAEEPVRWGPGTAARTCGLALVVGMVASLTSVVHLLLTEGLGWRAVLLPGPLTLAGVAAVQLNWRVVADSSGLWLTGAWHVRHVPWDRLRQARYTSQGSVELTLWDGGTWRLRGVGLPRAEQRLGLRPSYVRMVRDVALLHAHPELRPARPAPSRDRGLPLGPVVVFFTVVAVAAWFAG